MPSLEIQEMGKTIQYFDIQNESILIGSADEMDIMIDDDFVSHKHAEISKVKNNYNITDLNSTNHTFLNGTELKPNKPVRIRDKDEIKICGFDFIFHENHDNEHSKTVHDEGASNAASSELMSLRKKIYDELIGHFDDSRTKILNTDSLKLEDWASSQIDKLIQEHDDCIPNTLDRKILKKEIMNEVIGLGPIEELLHDDDISEIMVNGPKEVYYEKSGVLDLSNKQFYNGGQIMSVIERILSPIGRSINESSAYVDARLKDGSRVNAIIPPISPKGAVLTIRKFPEKKLTIDILINKKSINMPMVDFLKLGVENGKNIIVSGGTNTGKTTLLNVLSEFIPEHERIITIEDVVELKLQKAHVITLEARPPNTEGKGAITIRDLLRNALRMRPDRIIVGECRGGEAFDMLSAMNTGHDGSLSTIHSNSPRDAISKLANYIMMAGLDIPLRAIRQQIASAIDIIVQLTKLADGSRKVTNITEVCGMEGDTISLQDVFTYQTGIDSDGKVLDEFIDLSYTSKILNELKMQGITVNV